MLYPTAVVEVATTRKQSNRLLAYCSTCSADWSAWIHGRDSKRLLKMRCMMVNITVVSSNHCHTYLLQILRQVIVAADLHYPNLEHIGTIMCQAFHIEM